MKQEMINDIIRDAKEKYKDFSLPNYSFVSPLLKMHLDLYRDLLENYFVIDNTDFNCDVCLHYYVEKDSIHWEVCASLVGRYAMISRQINNQNWIIVSDEVCIDSLDEEILQLVKKHYFSPLPECVLKSVIPGFKFETDDGEMQNWAYVYQVLFFYANYDLLLHYKMN